MTIKPDVYLERVNDLRRHIEHVQELAYLLGERLFKSSEDDRFLAHELITNVQSHDQSKFRGIEWEYLHDSIKDTDSEKFLLAWEQHVKTNPHHPEYWAGIKNMPDVYIAEFVCDTFSRSSEFGTDYSAWLDAVATKKYNFTKRSGVWKKIKKYKDILINKPSFDKVPVTK
jgi:hypothetical protein